MMRMATKHKLSNVDKYNAVADCEVCGEGVPIEPKGKGVRCKLAARENRRQYKNRNKLPQSRSKHSLRGGTTCPICGPVEPVPWGRGFMCPNRASQLGFVPQEQPAPRCSRCMAFLVAGECMYCTPLRIDLPDGFHISELGLTARSESVVPGWKVIGPPLPEGSPWAAYLLDNEL